MSTDTTASARRARILRVLFFYSALALLLLVASPDYVDAERVSKRIMVLARCGLLAGVFAYAAFYRSIVTFVQADSRRWERIAAVPVALVSALLLARRARGFGVAQACVCGLFALFALFVLLLFLWRMARLVVCHTVKHPDYSPRVERSAPGKRWGIAAALMAATALLCALSLHKGQNWGADYALYIWQGMKLAQGVRIEMAAAWGYSAILALVYLLCGYDTVGFTDVLYYKIPGVVCLVLTVLLMYLFFSKRFGRKWAALLTLLFSINPTVIGFTNDIVSNVPYLCVSMAALLLLERLFDGSVQRPGRQALLSILAGAAIWASNLIRGNGKLLLLSLACLQFLLFLAWVFRRGKLFPALTCYAHAPSAAANLLPYVVYGLLALSVSSIPVESTSASLLRETSMSHFLSNIQYYYSIFNEFFWSITRSVLPAYAVPMVWVPLLALGLVRGFRRELLSVIYFCGTMLLLFLLIFRQGERYIIPVMPLMLLFTGIGAGTIYEALCARFGETKQMRAGALACMLLLLANLLLSNAAAIRTNWQNGRELDEMSFSEDAKAAYVYIQAHTDEDDIIVFNKPRVVLINANRTTFGDIYLPEAGERAYYLVTSDPFAEHQWTDDYDSVEALGTAYGAVFTPVYENPRFVLYEITRAGA